MVSLSWRSRIALAKQRGYFNKADLRDCSSWPDCACGEQNPFIPRDGDGSPEDRELHNLGVEFALAVKEDDFYRTETLLEDIERRAAEIVEAEQAIG